MNGITVPKQYKNMMRADRDNDQREADIKMLLDARKGMVITTADFIEATGATSAMLHVKRLMKAVYITRHKVKQAGKRAKIEPTRVDYAIEQLEKAGHTVTKIDDQSLKVNGRVTLWPYTGWFSGKGVGSGRGIHNLLKKLS